jgi:hypothetical protein
MGPCSRPQIFCNGHYDIVLHSLVGIARTSFVVLSPSILRVLDTARPTNRTTRASGLHA